jgi:hypothetical protein
MIRRAPISCAGVALAVSFFLTPAVPQAQGRGGPPAQRGQQGGLPALQARVQALEEHVIALEVALLALGVDLQEKVALLSADLALLRGEIGTLTVDMSTLTTRVADLEATVADLGAGLTSYDALAGLPCTTAAGGALDSASREASNPNYVATITPASGPTIHRPTLEASVPLDR